METKLIRNEKPHSYEIGKVGNRHKIYYNKVAELKAQIKELKEAGLMEEDIKINYE